MTEIFYKSTALWETALQMVWKRAPKGIEDRVNVQILARELFFFLTVDKYLNVYIYSDHFIISQPFYNMHDGIYFIQRTGCTVESKDAP